MPLNNMCCGAVQNLYDCAAIQLNLAIVWYVAADQTPVLMCFINILQSCYKSRRDTMGVPNNPLFFQITDIVVYHWECIW